MKDKIELALPILPTKQTMALDSHPESSSPPLPLRSGTDNLPTRSRQNYPHSPKPPFPSVHVRPYRCYNLALTSHWPRFENSSGVRYTRPLMENGIDPGWESPSYPGPSEDPFHAHSCFYVESGLGREDVRGSNSRQRCCS